MINWQLNGRISEKWWTRTGVVSWGTLICCSCFTCRERILFAADQVLYETIYRWRLLTLGITIPIKKIVTCWQSGQQVVRAKWWKKQTDGGCHTTRAIILFTLKCAWHFQVPQTGPCLLREWLTRDMYIHELKNMNALLFIWDTPAYPIEWQQHCISHLLTCCCHDEIRKWWQVMERVVDVVKFIGVRGLSLIMKQKYTWQYGVDHGTFLESVKLLGKYDS